MDYLVRREDILEWERAHGTIQQGNIVLFHTNRARLYTNRSGPGCTPTGQGQAVNQQVRDRL